MGGGGSVLANSQNPGELNILPTLLLELEHAHQTPGDLPTRQIWVQQVWGGSETWIP